MSFQNFDSFPNQADAAAAAPGAPAPADAAMTGTADPSGAPFQGPAPGEPAGAAVPQQGNEGKTTLWYVLAFVSFAWSAQLTNVFSGWVSLSPGLTRTSSATSGSRWVSRSTSR